MIAMVQNGSFKDRLIHVFEENESLISRNDPSYVTRLRYESFNKFRELGMPTRKNEDWKYTDLTETLSKDYYQYLQPQEENSDIDSIFACEVHNFKTDQISLLNGWHVRTAEPLRNFNNGMIAGGLADAMRIHPDIIEKHYAKYADSGKNIFHALNTAFAQDGVFIYVPDNVVIEKPVQIISIINHDQNLFLQTRNLIVLGKNSQITLVQCDDSTNQQASFNNSMTEVFLDENSHLEHYKLQNLNNISTLLNSTYFHLKENSRLTTFSITLNGGMIRNYTNVKLNGQGAGADVFGLYLMDRKQHVDNQVFIEHAVPNCTSNELYKGILDDEAMGIFNGHILVQRDAQKTIAFQSNRNILLTDKATANARPFLEIYADDVKCGHGATVGQLDTEALFYIRSRGICLASARLLLMYAFAAEVINKITIGPLKTRIDDMVKRRLKGELSICDHCVLHCKNQEKEITFDIDLSKI
jgi:Fe-S cluster assembly protein SufD